MKTPRTDANTYGGKGIVGAGYVSADFARSLEMELNKALAELAEFKLQAVALDRLAEEMRLH